MLGTPIGSDILVAGLLSERMTRVDDFLPAATEMDDPHISTQMIRMCPSVVQFVHILRATPHEQSKTLLDEYDAPKYAWTDHLLPEIPSLPEDSHIHASLDREYGGLGLLPARVVATPAEFVSKADTARAVAMLPRQRSLS